MTKTPEYAWVEGGLKFAVDPTIVGNVLDGIRERDGRVTPEAVVAAAKPKRSPLHRVIFRDDDETAAYRHRLNIAMKLVVSVRRVDREPSLPQYVHIAARPADNVSRGYVSQDDLTVPSIRAAMLEEARKYLEGARRRWGRLSELAGVWAELDALVETERKAA